MSNFKKKKFESFRVKLKVEAINYQKDEFGIYRCSPIDSSKEIKLNWKNEFNVKGNIPYDLRVGKVYTIYMGNPEYNEQYKNHTYEIDKFEVEQLTKPEEQFEFLQTVTTANLYKQFVEHYDGQNIIDLIFNDQIDFNKIKGLQQATFDNLKEKLEMYKDLGKLQILLKPLGVSVKAITKIANHFDSPDRAHRILTESLYNLCEVKGYGFTKVDEIALKANYPERDPIRISECLKYIIDENTKDGHSWSYREDIKSEALEYLNIEPHLIDEILNNAPYEKGKYYKPNDIIVVGELVSLYRLYKDEHSTLMNLIRIRDNYVPPVLEDIDELIGEAGKELGITYTEEQIQTIKESFNNGIFTINGSAGTGKCVDGKTIVYTDKGMIKIEDIPNYYHVNEDSEGEAKIISYDMNGNKSVKNTSHFFNMSKSETVNIKTKQGYNIKGTPEHPLLTINEDGNLEWKKLKDYNEGDIVCVSKNNNIFGSEDKVDKDLAYVIGLLIGDGTYNIEGGKEKRWKIGLTNYEKEIYEFYINFMESRFDVTVKSYAKKTNPNSITHQFGSRDVGLYFKNEIGMNMTTSHFKSIPQTILNSPKEVVRKVLQGLFDTDGGMMSKGFEWSTSSETLAHQVHLCLLNFGIMSNLRIKKVKGYEHNYYIITISNLEYLSLFEKEIGFNLSFHKKQRLSEMTKKFNAGMTNIRSKSDSLHNLNKKINLFHKQLIQKEITYKNPTYKICTANGETSLGRGRDTYDLKRVSSSYTVRQVLNHTNWETSESLFLNNISNNFYLDRVLSIDNGESIVYDFTVPETHSFVANGIVNHNTTIVKAITHVLNKMGRSYHGAVLSGKGSQVMTSKGIQSSTIHRLLGYNGDGFAYDEDNQLPYHTVILDEASMTNASLWNSLTSAIPSGSQILVVGDNSQLSCINAGDVLRDIMSSTQTKRKELTQIHRQAADSGVIEVAHKIRRGENITGYNREITENYGKNEDLTIIARSKPKKEDVVLHDFMNDEEIKMAQNPIYQIAKEIAISQVSKILQSTNPEQGILEFQVITPTKSAGALSVDSMNKLIQREYNDSKISIKLGKGTFFEKDKVIINGNTYRIPAYASITDYKLGVTIKDEELKTVVYIDEDGGRHEKVADEPSSKEHDLFNGTIGIVKHVDIDGEKILVKFEGIDGLICLDDEACENLDLGYAITIHKSQGSGFPNVMVLFDFGAFKMLSRELIYTAITRTSGRCVVVCENNALYKSCETTSSGNRRTFLSLFLEQLDAQS